MQWFVGILFVSWMRAFELKQLNSPFSLLFHIVLLIRSFASNSFLLDYFSFFYFSAHWVDDCAVLANFISFHMWTEKVYDIVFRKSLFLSQQVIERNEKRKKENPFSVFFLDLSFSVFFSSVIFFSIWFMLLETRETWTKSWHLWPLLVVEIYEHQPWKWFYFKLFWHVFGNY